jgi:hypothetical protein
MIWVFGNSHERVPIKDLNDFIYFRQKKQYTDQEFEKSRDLQREIQQGRIVKLEQKPEIRSSLPDSIETRGNQVVPTLDLREMRRVISEVISENKTDGLDLKSLVVNLIPIIAETVRQEVSRIPSQQVYVQAGERQTSEQAFQDLSYIPDIKLDGLKSNISIESQQVDGGGLSDSLNALKNLGKSI